jgi:hypothetical protein
MAQAAEPFSFVHPTSGLPALVGYQLDGQPNGRCLQWEWRYFHYKLHTRDLKGWLKDSGHQILNKVLSHWVLPESEVDCGRSDSSVCTRLTCGTRAVGFLLCHAANVRCLKADIKASTWAMCRAWFALAVQGINRLRAGERRFDITIAGRLRTFQVNPGTGVLAGDGLAALLAEHPKLQAAWRAKGPLVGGWKSDLEQPHISDFFIFLVSLPDSVAQTIDCLITLVGHLSQILAGALNLFVLQQYLIQNGRSQPVPVLKGKVTSRNLDPINRLHVNQQMKDLSGSQVHTAKAVTGSGWHAQAYRHANILLYDKQTRYIFSGARQVCLAVDPGTYSGEMTNIGIIYNPRKDTTAVLPAKVNAIRYNII